MRKCTIVFTKQNYKVDKSCFLSNKLKATYYLRKVIKRIVDMWTVNIRFCRSTSSLSSPWSLILHLNARLGIFRISIKIEPIFSPFLANDYLDYHASVIFFLQEAKHQLMLLTFGILLGDYESTKGLISHIIYQKMVHPIFILKYFFS